VVGWGNQNHAVFEQADGEFALEHGRNDGDAGDLYAADTAATFGDTTQPGSRWWDGTSSGLQISQIAAAGNAMTFKVWSDAVAATAAVAVTARRARIACESCCPFSRTPYRVRHSLFRTPPDRLASRNTHTYPVCLSAFQQQGKI